MSTRREFARQVVGAIVGVSVIPPVGEKPKWYIPPVSTIEKWPTIFTDRHIFSIPPYVPLPTSQRTV